MGETFSRTASTAFDRVERGVRGVSLRVVVPVVLLFACNLADVATTHRLLSMGAHEMNPVAGWLLATHGLLLAKLTLVLMIGITAAVAPPRRWILPALWVGAGVYSTIIAFHLTQLALA